MKNDPISFKILSAVIIAGVILALVAPDRSAKSNAAPIPPPAAAASE